MPRPLAGICHPGMLRWERRRASDFPQGLLRPVDRYVHGDISRREFLDGAQNFAVGGVTAAALFEMLRPNYTWAIQVPHQGGDGHGAVAAGLRKHQGLLGASGECDRKTSRRARRARGELNLYIEDVARRSAIADFVAFAPDGLTSVGGYPGDVPPQLFAQLDPAKMTEDFFAAITWLKSPPDCTGRVAAIGFCFGGAVTNQQSARGADGG